MLDTSEGVVYGLGVIKRLQEHPLADETPSTAKPVSASATALGFAQDAPHPSNDPSFLNEQALALLAAHVAPITWTFDADQKAYLGAAPYGTFELRRQAGSERLYCEFKSACGTQSSRINLIEDSVAEAKAVVLPRLMESLNQSRRLSLIVPAVTPASTTAPAEPDLI